MANFHEFDEKRINEALDAARKPHAKADVAAAKTSSNVTDTGELSLLAECIEVKVENNQICLKLPLGFGQVCIPIPVNIPNGTAAKACLHICTTLGIPHGVKVTISVAGITIVTKKFGKC